MLAFTKRGSSSVMKIVIGDAFDKQTKTFVEVMCKVCSQNSLKMQPTVDEVLATHQVARRPIVASYHVHVPAGSVPS